MSNIRLFDTNDGEQAGRFARDFYERFGLRVETISGSPTVTPFIVQLVDRPDTVFGQIYEEQISTFIAKWMEEDKYARMDGGFGYFLQVTIVPEGIAQGGSTNPDGIYLQAPARADIRALCEGCAQTVLEEPNVLAMVRFNRDFGHFINQELALWAIRELPRITRCQRCAAMTSDERLRVQRAALHAARRSTGNTYTDDTSWADGIPQTAAELLGQSDREEYTEQGGKHGGEESGTDSGAETIDGT